MAHSLAPLGLPYYAAQTPSLDFQWKSFHWNGLFFRNRVGIAGGVDKNGENLLNWQKLGAGFLEIGTITPYAQTPNKGKILDRDWDNGNLWNRMGFPNHGSDEIYFNLRNQKDELQVPTFVNIGKNRQRPNDEAELDYLYLAERFSNLADGFVINISSPNTAGLRSLQSPQFIESVLKGTNKIMAKKVPTLLKLSPDMAEDDFIACVEAAASNGAQGFVLTNTTLSRPKGCPFPPEGGLSGRALCDLSRRHLEKIVKILGPRKSDFLIVSVGGISDREEVIRRLDLGADLVQLYSALVFAGPQLLTKVVAPKTREVSLAT